MIRRLAVTLAALVALTATAHFTWAQAAESDLPFDPTVRRGTLSNGLAYYVKDHPEPRNRAALWLAVRAGSVLEEERERGVAHFVEHMAFNGTTRFAGNEVVSYLESIGSRFGAHVNAHTSYDETVYKLEVPTDDAAALETAFEILSDWAYAISFDPEESVRERGVVLEEWRKNRRAAGRLLEQELRMIFGASRYAERLPIGVPEIIETATAELLRGFYERWYRPDLMAVIAVGDFDAARIEDAIRRHFAPPPEGMARQARAARPEPPTKPPHYPIPTHTDTRIGVVTDPELILTALKLFYRLPADTGQDRAAYRRRLVESLFTSMANARLFERAQEVDPPFVGGWIDARLQLYALHNDVVRVLVMPADAAGVMRALDGLLEEMQRILRYGFTATELERAKVTLLRGAESAWLERDRRPSRELTDLYKRHFVEGRVVPGSAADYALNQQLVPEISLAEVNQVAARWRDPGNTVVLLSGPEVAAGPEVEQALLARLTGAAALVVEPYADLAGDVPLLAKAPQPGSITAEHRIEAIDAVQWTLSNRVTVIAKQTDFKNDEVLVLATSPGGTSLVADADYVSAGTATALVTGSGAGVHDQVALQKLLAGNTAAVQPVIGDLFEGFSGSSSPQDLETLFQLITLYATAARLDPTYYATLYALLQSLAETLRAQPDSVFEDTLASVLSQDHFRKRPLTPETLKELSLERAEAVYADRFQDFSDFTFIVVGAFDWQRLRSLTESYLAALPSAGRREQWRDEGIDPPPGVVERAVRMGTEPRAVTRLVFAGEMAWSRTESVTLQALSSVLQIRLRELLREELGGVYSVSVTRSAKLLPDPEYKVQVSFSSDPARADEMLEAVFSVVEWLSGGGEQSYLDKFKEGVRTARDESFRTNFHWLDAIARVVHRGERFSVITRTSYDQRLDALTLEQVAAAARRYLRRDRYVRVLLLPETTAE